MENILWGLHQRQLAGGEVKGAAFVQKKLRTTGLEATVVGENGQAWSGVRTERFGLLFSDMKTDRKQHAVF